MKTSFLRHKDTGHVTCVVRESNILREDLLAAVESVDITDHVKIPLTGNFKLPAI